MQVQATVNEQSFTPPRPGEHCDDFVEKIENGVKTYQCMTDPQYDAWRAQQAAAHNNTMQIPAWAILAGLILICGLAIALTAWVRSFPWRHR